jgi:hypothetical protein
LGELFHLDYDLMLYDVTSTYFEGLAQGNEIAKRGHSRDHRSDCTQVCIALVVTREGMPLGYEIFPGNRTDVTTVEEIVETMERRFGLAKRVWVMDRGMTSEGNLEWLQSTGRRYLLGTSRAEMKNWSSQLAEARGWKQVREGIEVKLAKGRGGKRPFYCVGRPIVARKSWQCTSALFCESKPASRALRSASRNPTSGSRRTKSSASSGGCCSAIPVLPGATKSNWWTIANQRRDSD